ncbi:MAG: VanZ family protein [Chloroflexota bacterium]
MPVLFRWVAEPLAFFLAIAILIVLVALPLTVWRAGDERFAIAARRTGKDVALLVSLALIVTLTFAPLLEEAPRLPVNLLPFRDQLLALRGEIQMSRALAELGANVLLFVPFGMSLSWRSRRRRVLPVVLVALAVSVGVEAVQALSETGRQADVTDLLANVSGAFAGAALVRRIVTARS